MNAERRPMWMVRAGEGSFRFEDFKSASRVSIGWLELGDMSLLKTREDFVQAVDRATPGQKKLQVAVSAGQTFRFVREIKPGDAVVTYDSSARMYLVGTIMSDYEFKPEEYPEQPNIRRVTWRAQVARDELSVATRNSLGAISTLFLIPAEASAEIESRLSGNYVVHPESIHPMPEAAATDPEVSDLYRDLHAKSLEFIKDKVSQLDWDEMQELVAGVLRAMGYKTRVSPSGSDRGKDIVASPDGFGFEDPRIVVEVKHRQAAMGSQEIRGFLGGRHDGDKGLYVSTGGFTKDARYRTGPNSGDAHGPGRSGESHARSLRAHGYRDAAAGAFAQVVLASVAARSAARWASP
jgi:restriction system protein